MKKKSFCSSKPCFCVRFLNHNIKHRTLTAVVMHRNVSNVVVDKLSEDHEEDGDVVVGSILAAANVAGDQSKGK